MNLNIDYFQKKFLKTFAFIKYLGIFAIVTNLKL